MPVSQSPATVAPGRARGWWARSRRRRRLGQRVPPAAGRRRGGGRDGVDCRRWRKRDHVARPRRSSGTKLRLARASARGRSPAGRLSASGRQRRPRLARRHAEPRGPGHHGCVPERPRGRPAMTGSRPIEGERHGLHPRPHGGAGRRGRTRGDRAFDHKPETRRIQHRCAGRRAGISPTQPSRAGSPRSGCEPPGGCSGCDTCGRRTTTRTSICWRSATARSTGRSRRAEALDAEQAFYRSDERAAAVSAQIAELAGRPEDARLEHLVGALRPLARRHGAVQLTLAAAPDPAIGPGVRVPARRHRGRRSDALARGGAVRAAR